MRVRFVYEKRHYATMVKIRHGLATLNHNNSVVYGQKHKVWVLVFLERQSILRPKLSRFGEIFCFATKPHRLQQLHARNAGNIHQMALCNSTSGRPQHLGVIVLTILQTGMK